MNSFKIEPLTGLLTLAASLDYEQVQQVSVTVTCSDYGEPTRLSANLTLLVNVTDLNDNPPKFLAETPRKIQVLESARAGAEIAKLKAVDRDLSEAYSRVSYNLTSAMSVNNLGQLNSVDLFRVDSQTGSLSLSENASLDYSLIKVKLCFKLYFF